MKILFIHAASEHIGIEYLSACLKARGHETSLIFDPAQFSGQENARIPLISKLADITGKMIRAAARSDADMICFSAYTVNFRWALEMAKRIREHCSAPIVFGGPHATATPERVIAHPQIDAVVVGEGEDAIVELAEGMRDGKLPQTSIPNVWIKHGEKIIAGKPRPYIKNLDALPFPDKNLFYSKIPAFAENYMIMAARGCPYRCTFCSNSLYQDLYAGEKNHVRRRSVQNVVDEIEAAQKTFNIKTVSFWDDVFTMSKKWLAEFGQLYKKLQIPYDCYTHPLSIDDQRAEILAETGCFRVKIGLQTVNDSTREKYLDRAGIADDVAKAIEILHKHGVSVGVDHLLGLPDEGDADQKKAAEFFLKTKPDRINSYWMLYFPGAKITELERNRGEISEERFNNIVDGLDQSSYIYASPEAGIEKYKLRGYQTFFDLAPLLPSFIAKFLIEKGLIHKLPYSPLLRQSIVAAAAVFQNDKRYRQHLKLLISRKNVP